MVVLHIAGLGPAGAIVALRAAERGWDVTAWDPRVRTEGRLPRWPATYGALMAEVPEWGQRFFSPAYVPRTVTHRERPLAYSYAMLNKDSLRREVEVSTAKIRRGTVPSATGSPHRVVIDCTGAPTDTGVFWQVAVGYVLPRHLFSDANLATFMDWQQPTPSPPSFLYIQPTDEGILCEETVLATRTSPRQLIDELTQRLEARLDAEAPEWRKVLREQLHRGEFQREVVVIPMGTRKAGASPMDACPPGQRYYFGAAAGLINPATGYSVGAALNQVDQLLDRIAEDHASQEGTHQPRKARLSRRNAHRVARRANAELARALRRIGAELISQASHTTLRDFFDAFFQLGAQRQLTYLTGHDGLAVAATMWALRGFTGFNHPFLQPIWKRPGHMIRVAAGK